MKRTRRVYSVVKAGERAITYARKKQKDPDRTVSHFEVEMAPIEDGTVHARIRPLTNVSEVLGKDGLQLSESVLDVVGDMLLDIVNEKDS